MRKLRVSKEFLIPHDYRRQSPTPPTDEPVNSRTTSIVAVTVVFAVVVLALIAQITLLGALGTAATVGSGSSAKLTFTPAANAQLIGVGATAPIKFDASRGAAVAQVRGLNISARDVLAMSLATEDITGNAKLALGWLSTQNINRPATASANLGAGIDPKNSIVMLSGHPRWRESITQIALGFENAGGSELPPGAVVTDVELIPASPFGALRLLSNAWFKTDGNVITPNEAANRLLPLALWLALISAASVVVMTLIFRRNPPERAAALKATVTALTVLSGAATVLANHWPGWTVPIGAGMAAVIALVLIYPPRPLPLSSIQSLSLALAALGVCVVLSPLVAAVTLVPALMLMLTRSPSSAKVTSMPVIPIGAGLAAVPMLLLAAVSQGLITAPALLTPLADPTRALASVAAGSGGLPALALGILIVHQLWPSPALAPRWSSGAATAAIWALAGALFVLAVPKIAVMAQGGSTYIALFFPALTCLGLALLPKFREIAQSLAETQVSDAKTEADLSTQALALLESHAERVQTTLARREIGAAHAALKQMQRIAPAARITHLAQLRLALADGDLTTAELAASKVVAASALTAADSDALLELAHRQNQQQRVIELAPGASPTENNRRTLAIAQLLSDGPAAAIATLSDWPTEHSFARELAELHLLSDDIAATQQALVNTGISLKDPIGQAYVARLGMRVQGPEPHAQGINSLATWHPQLGAVHAAQGELMLRQGNASGARARFVLAIKLDPALWPLQGRLQALDAAQSV